MTGMSQPPSEIYSNTDCVGFSDMQNDLHAIDPIKPNDVVPVIDESNYEAFNEVVMAFSEAERRMKAVEWIEGTDIPSINELRYVSYHIFKACQNDCDEKQQYEELKRAVRHCKRASYDAMELGIIAQLEKVAEFVHDHRDLCVSDHMSNYLSLMTEVEDIKNFLENSAGIESRDSYYEECELKLTRLGQINVSLRAAREELNKKRADLDLAEKRTADAEERAKAAELRADKAESRQKLALSLMYLSFLVTLANFMYRIGLGEMTLL